MKHVLVRLRVEVLEELLDNGELRRCRVDEETVGPLVRGDARPR